MIEDSFARLKAWLFVEVLPLWQEFGVDRQNGGFYERLNSDAQPVPNAPRRTRVVARQIYSFAAAGRLGWNGDWTEVVSHGANTLNDVCLREDGLVISTHSVDEAQSNPEFDLYDHAFALFAIAELARSSRWTEWAQAAAFKMLNTMDARFTAPNGGWLDSESDRELLRSNPHMHLLEAMLALHVATGSRDWLDRATGIAELAMRDFIGPETGALHEYFNLSWSFYPGDRGKIVEPGHQFEWSWLLHKWRQLSGNSSPNISIVADRLCAIGENYGVSKNGLVIDELWSDLSPKQVTSRTWPQTERAKACVMQAELATDPAAVAEWEVKAAEALDAILRFSHATGNKGLWFDRLLPDGSPIIEPAPASTLYHIMCAAEVVADYITRTRFLHMEIPTCQH